MTGHGTGTAPLADGRVSVELRSVNSRNFKLIVRSNVPYLALESRMAAELRKQVRRGSLVAQVTFERLQDQLPVEIIPEAFTAYYRQVEALLAEVGSGQDVPVDALLGWPGVVRERATAEEDEGAWWGGVSAALAEATRALIRMREAEGEAMARELLQEAEGIASRVAAIAQRAPEIPRVYRDRLLARVRTLLEGESVPVAESDLAREVALFADRADISEELTRLKSHLEQFRHEIEQGGDGKKLDFLLQEMNREANTTAAKANDDWIVQQVVELKAAIERMRELVQNVE
ncbi:MAG TPA: YicC family protein [Bryobacterales bacterium]|nr:YicC family protein [Bryobacterales bacterium]